MDIRPIHSENDYKSALAHINELWDAKPGTPESDELEILSVLVENYEKQHHAIESPDPIEAVKFRMEQLGLSRNDIASLIGSSGRVSEVLNNKRPLTLRMIRKLHAQLGIPADVLIQA